MHVNMSSMIQSIQILTSVFTVCVETEQYAWTRTLTSYVYVLMDLLGLDAKPVVGVYNNIYMYI